MKTQMSNINELKYPKILIVGTLPYNPNESSRALDTYFHNWPKEDLRMIYSNSGVPFNGQCSSYFQITDYQLFRKLFGLNGVVGKIYQHTQLNSSSISSTRQTNRFLSLIKKKTAFRYYARKFLWKKKRWLTEDLKRWVSEFSPDIIYVCFSDDYFILDIAYYFSQLYNLPIVVQIGDDYYFKKWNWYLKPYFNQYKQLFDKIMNTSGFGVYISDKLANQYNKHFSKQGFPVYLSSTVESELKDVIYSFNYFGKLNIGRYKSLAILGDALSKINPKFKISVYSNNASRKVVSHLIRHNCEFNQSLEYAQVLKIITSGSFNIIASGFSKKDIEIAKFSLSTKVADSLAAGSPIIAIGPEGDGAIDYLKNKNCAILLTNKKIDIENLAEKLFDQSFLRNICLNAKRVYIEQHSLERNRLSFEKRCIDLIGK